MELQINRYNLEPVIFKILLARFRNIGLGNIEKDFSIEHYNTMLKNLTDKEIFKWVNNKEPVKLDDLFENGPMVVWIFEFMLNVHLFEYTTAKSRIEFNKLKQEQKDQIIKVIKPNV